ncbi:MAG: CRISPR-associated endonuclease Cas1, partial [Vulcanimicrobiaceae bacterium]
MPIAERELKTRIPNDGGVVVLWGYGLKLRIDRRHLTLEDGAGLERRSARFAKAPAKIKRLVLLSTDGYLSLEVVRWLHDAGASLSILSPDGDVIAAFGPTRLDDGRLRRAQAIAPWTAAGLRIARELLARKVAGQAAVLRAFDLGDDGQRAHVDEAASWLRGSDSTHSIEEFTLAEAIAAGTYWDAWAPITVRYAQKDEPHVPEHWRRFDARMSLVTGRSRRASNPANALLNYLYALLEAETTIALRAYGLDPGLGVVHTDQPARASFACDVMEAGRPEADRIVIELLRSRVFRVRDFIETPDGGCRLTTPIARELAALTMRLGRAIGPAVEQVVRILETTPLEPADGRLPRARVANRKAPALPTFLTQSRRSEGRASIRRAGTERVMIAPRCTSCGKPIASS